MFDVVTSADSVRINPVGRSRVAAPPLAMGIVRLADLLAAHHDAVQCLAEIPGLGVDSAQQIIAEVGATAATFPSPKHLASWMGACPGNEESAGVNYSHRCPKGNRQMRRVLNQAANARGQGEGHHLRDRVSPARPAPRPRPSDRRDHSPALSSDLEDSSPERAVRGTRAGRQRRGQEGPHAQDDPRTANPRLSHRANLTRSGRVNDFRPWLITAG